jgi:type IV pilus assembly protein PilC
MSTSLAHSSHFTRQLGTLVAAGLPLLQALETMATSAQTPQLRDLITRLCVSLENGSAFHVALRQSAYFDALYCELVAAAEMAGNLDEVLLRLAALLERQQTLRSQIRSALAYPFAVLCITLVVVAVIMVWVVPVFEGIFSSLGAELPALTLAVLHASRWLTSGGAVGVAVCLALLCLLCQRLMKLPAVELWLDLHILRFPLVGKLMHHTQLSLWTLTLSDLLKAGVPMLDALEVLAASSTNRCLALASIELRSKVRQGRSLADAMLSLSPDVFFAPVFPPMLIQLVSVGEQSGALDSLLAKLAQQFMSQVDNLMREFTQLLEPLMMVVLGVVMGALVLALYLPVFQLGQVL